jgi:hypothetical protein
MQLEDRKRWRQRVVVAIRWLSAVVLVYLTVTWTILPGWTIVSKAKYGRDYSSYHFATELAANGQDPYSKKEIQQVSRKEQPRKARPYLYPPPFLLTMLWSLPMNVHTGYRVMYFINLLCLVVLLLLIWRWFRPDPLLLLFLTATFTPIIGNLKMGQANIPMFALAVAGLATGRGAFLGAAAMAKMSPALYLGMFAAQRRWRPIAVACATAVLLTLVSLLLVSFEDQYRFYSEILPGYSRGDYNKLSIPLTMKSNHSLPNMLAQIWPGRWNQLSPAARIVSSLITLGTLAALCWLARKQRDPLGQAALAASFTVLLLLTPVFTYEHHFVLLLLPLAVLGSAAVRGRIHFSLWLPLLVVYLLAAQPLKWLDSATKAHPDLGWYAQESKFFAAVLIGMACAWVAWRSPAVNAGPQTAGGNRREPQNT